MSAASDPRVMTREQAQTLIERVVKMSKAEAIRKFRILPVDFTEQGGHLTPSLKIKRSVVAKEFAADIDALYTK